MITESFAKTERRPSSLASRAWGFAQKLKWLSPTESLASTKSGDFGRTIETSLKQIKKGHGIIRLQLRNRDAAVVMSIDHYEEVMRMKEIYTVMVEQIREKEIAEATNEFEKLYHRITSPTSRQAADALFSASSDDLRASYKPGRTESL